MYSEKLMKHFQNPKNMGEIKNADAVGKVGNFQCGDIMHVFIKVKNNVIKDIKFKTMGCAAAIAASDVVCELAKGKTIEDAMKLTKQDIVEFLEGMPPQKIHCSILGIEALQDAVKNYKTKHK